jgi:hypothetical protein
MSITPDEVKKLEEELEELRVLYEKYFLGVERQPPDKKHEEVAKKIRTLAETFTPNTALRFRLQNLKAKLISYEYYWKRVLREIEEGTYYRHLYRLKRLGLSTAPPAEQKREVASDPYDRIIEDYRRALTSAGKTPPPPEKLRALLKQQEEDLRRRHQGKRIEFKVEIEGGTPKIKAILKREGSS